MLQNISMCSNCSFTHVTELVKRGIVNVPNRFVLPPIQRPNCKPCQHSPLQIPLIDVSSLQHQSCRSEIIREVHLACKTIGCFQVCNHGIHHSVVKDALHAATEFFDLSDEEKHVYASNDIHEPVRYGTSLNQNKDSVHYWRDFIKHYSHPISSWIDLWPSNPPVYKKKMGEYAVAAHILHKLLMEIVFESLGLNPDYLQEDIHEGSQLMTINYYSTCPQPELVLGLPPHTDYGYQTIILQNNPGLEIMTNEKTWHPVQCGEGALIVLLGDQTEIISNGQYKSPFHRAIVSSEKNRISIASLHSLGIERRVGPAAQLVDGEHNLCYKEGSFGDFLNFISKNDITQQRYINTLKRKT